MVGKICEAKKVIYYVFRNKKIPFQEKLERDFFIPNQEINPRTLCKHLPQPWLLGRARGYKGQKMYG